MPSPLAIFYGCLFSPIASAWMFGAGRAALAGKFWGGRAGRLGDLGAQIGVKVGWAKSAGGAALAVIRHFLALCLLMTNSRRAETLARRRYLAEGCPPLRGRSSPFIRVAQAVVEIWQKSCDRRDRPAQMQPFKAALPGLAAQIFRLPENFEAGKLMTRRVGVRGADLRQSDRRAAISARRRGSGSGLMQRSWGAGGPCSCGVTMVIGVAG